eukprot:PhM_4_TR1475/c0_g1_i1/m.5073
MFRHRCFTFLLASNSGSSSVESTALRHLATLGLERIPPLAEVRSRYLALARDYHPDVAGGSTHKMSEINTAYEALQDMAVSNPNLFGGSKQKTSSDASSAAAGGRDGLGQRRGPRVPPRNVVDWSYEFRVPASEKQNPLSHPATHNERWSLQADRALFQALRNGNSVRQVARSLGMSERDITGRVKEPQFRRRCQVVLGRERADRTMARNYLPETRKEKSDKFDAAFRFERSQFV